MLSSIKTMKRICKATLNVFFYDDKKKFYLIDFLCEIEIFTKHVKIVKNSKFFFSKFLKT